MEIPIPGETIFIFILRRGPRCLSCICHCHTMSSHVIIDHILWRLIHCTSPLDSFNLVEFLCQITYHIYGYKNFRLKILWCFNNFFFFQWEFISLAIGNFRNTEQLPSICYHESHVISQHILSPFTSVASFTKEVNPRLAKRSLKTNGRLANRVNFLSKRGPWMSGLCEATFAANLLAAVGSAGAAMSAVNQ